MPVLRTPDSRFANLVDYPFAPNYALVQDSASGAEVRMHYVDVGPRDAKPVLMLHGEPSWSYLYRHMIPVCADVGHRVIAPDLIGFGKSDKLSEVSDYTYARHIEWMVGFIEALDLTDITLVCQDWGSLIGLRVAAEHPQRFARIVVGNGFLPTGDQKVPAAFSLWKGFALHTPVFPVGRIVSMGTSRGLSTAERKAYDAPFPSQRYKAAARAFPALVPVAPNDPATPANRRAWEVLKAWTKPFLTTFSDGDPITRGGAKALRELIPGAQGQAHTTLRGGHFLQEDSPREFANAVNAFIAAT